MLRDSPTSIIATLPRHVRNARACSCVCVREDYRHPWIPMVSRQPLAKHTLTVSLLRTGYSAG